VLSPKAAIEYCPNGSRLSQIQAVINIENHDNPMHDWDRSNGQLWQEAVPPGVLLYKMHEE